MLIAFYNDTSSEKSAFKAESRKQFDLPISIQPPKIIPAETVHEMYAHLYRHTVRTGKGKPVVSEVPLKFDEANKRIVIHPEQIKSIKATFDLFNRLRKERPRLEKEIREISAMRFLKDCARNYGLI